MLRIFINPGHDMDLDPGACANNLREVDIALGIGQEVKNIMEGIGYPCQIIQSDNLNGETPSKPNVCATANNSSADIFVSIHCNSVANSSAKGTETLVYALDGGKSNILAKCIQAQIVNSLNMVDRGVKARPDLCVLRETSMPAVLVETAFISNEEDAYKLMYRIEEFANAISRGITDAEKLF
ncbi:N-acetylmuramoyl-L-alanine amidase family protein [Megamonas funiformis]|uniref:N-acetylmuramoyl-L-alanine amidase family protein n=1 Tax=Megamonas funiformis TaxID=437897 RepID=UPI0026775B6F|nr:N-acetylmuramoyl-L-alanine amidase [Megamonas funiformis]